MGVKGHGVNQCLWPADTLPSDYSFYRVLGKGVSLKDRDRCKSDTHRIQILFTRVHLDQLPGCLPAFEGDLEKSRPGA